MDSNFFEYLIIIFFIVSALQSLFGKKKKQRQKERQAQQRHSEQQSSQSQSKSSKEENPKDILEQLFGLKIPDQSEQTERQTKIPSDTDTEVLDPSGYHDTTWNPEEEYQDSIGVETVRYENQQYRNRYSKTEYVEPVRKAEQQSTAKKIMGKIPTKMEVEKVGGTDKETIQFIERIRNNISNPDSIREYILVSEILNKPKALRR